MKKLFFLIPVFLILHRAAAVPSFDPFADATTTGGTTYEIGGNLIGQNNSTLFSPWYSRGSITGSSLQPTLSAGNLAYPELPPPAGNSISFVGAVAQSACLDLNLPAQHTNTVYASFLLRLTDLSAVSTTAANNPIAAFLDDPTALANSIGRLGSRIVTKKVGAGYVLGTSKSALTADFVYEPDTAAHSTNDVLFVIVSYQRTGNVQTNVQLWVNPASSSFGSESPPTPTLVATAGTTALNVNNARAFGILQQFTTAPSGIIDDVRVGTNWVFVTGGDPAIVQNPSNQTAPESGTAVFNVEARGTPTLTYQWIKDGTTPLSDGGNISGATAASLTVSSISVSDVGTYSVIVSNGVGAFAQSGSANLAIADPAIIGQPQSRTNEFETTATFEVTAAGTGPFTYQWRKIGVGNLNDGGNISGSQSNVLTLTGVTFPDSGNYAVTVTGSLGPVDSVEAQLAVRDPIVLTDPASVTNVAGTEVTFSVVADGTPSLTYQWRKNDVDLNDGGNISGATTDTLTIANISSVDEAAYKVVVTGGFGSTEASQNATLTVLNPVSITAQPNSRTVIAGAKAVLSVGASGTAPLSYQWQIEEANIPGATSASYILTNVQPPVTGNYRVIVLNSLNSATSSVAVVAITNSLNLQSDNIVVIRVGDGAQTLTANGNSMFLDQFTGYGNYVSTINIPDEGASAMITLGPNQVAVPSSVTGSGLTRSADGRFVVLAGYNTPIGYGSTLNTATSAAVPRGVGLVDSLGQYTLGLASTDSTYSATFWRAAVTDGTNNFWGAARAGATYYLGLSDPPELVQSVFSNLRSTAIFNGSIYCVSAVSGNNGVLKLDGMPRTSLGSNPEVLFSGSTGSSDLEVSPNGNLIYLADDRGTPNGGIQRWEFLESVWTNVYTLSDGLPLGARYLTVDFQGANPIIYAVTREATDENNRLVRIEDVGAGSLTTTVATSGANQNFRGLRLGPGASATQPTLSAVRDGNNIILNWSGAYFLQSASNDVAGPYDDVPGASAPHTNDTFGAQKFFRLRD